MFQGVVRRLEHKEWSTKNFFCCGWTGEACNGDLQTAQSYEGLWTEGAPLSWTNSIMIKLAVLATVALFGYSGLFWIQLAYYLRGKHAGDLEKVVCLFKKRISNKDSKSGFSAHQYTGLGAAPFCPALPSSFSGGSGRCSGQQGPCPTSPTAPSPQQAASPHGALTQHKIFRCQLVPSTPTWELLSQQMQNDAAIPASKLQNTLLICISHFHYSLGTAEPFHPSPSVL